MENLLNLNNLVKLNLTIGQIPLWKILLVVIVLTLVILLKQLVSEVIISRIEPLTRKTNTTLDDRIVEIIKQPLGWLIFLAGLGGVNLIISEYLSSDLRTTINHSLSLIAIVIVAYIIYRTAPLLGEILGNLAVHTETELDDLLVPYLPRLFQTAAVIIVALKASEILLGTSVGALIGLLGGAGVAIGLLLKDIIYDWCCTIIIYTDNLYRPGDRLKVKEIEGFVNVLDVGLRSTKLHLISSDSIQKLPNSQMITGIIQNWSQNPNDEESYGINMQLKIDGISAKKTATICERLEQIPKSMELLHDQSLMMFEGIEGNARVIGIYVSAKKLESYYVAWHQLSLEILTVLEEENIDRQSMVLLAYPDDYKQSVEAMNANSR